MPFLLPGLWTGLIFVILLGKDFVCAQRGGSSPYLYFKQALTACEWPACLAGAIFKVLRGGQGRQLKHNKKSCRGGVWTRCFKPWGHRDHSSRRWGDHTAEVAPSSASDQDGVSGVPAWERTGSGVRVRDVGQQSQAGEVGWDPRERPNMLPQTLGRSRLV